METHYVPPYPVCAVSLLCVCGVSYCPRYQAAVRDRHWSLASSLFDEAERRFLKATSQAGTSNVSGGEENASDRSPRELRKTAISSMAPTALSYHLALQVST